MEPEIRVDASTAAGVKFAEISDFLELNSLVKVNVAGALKMILRGDHPVLASLENNSHIELYYKYSGKSWTKFFGGLYRSQERTQPKEPYFALTAVGYLALLRMRIVAYPALVANKTYFSAAKAETIMKSLVTANITSAATTANGRIRNGTNWPATVISIAADGAGGSTQEWYCAQENLLETLQKLAATAVGDFDLVKTAANVFEFRFYAGQLGTNRTGSVVFSLGHGNMRDPIYSYNRLNEATAAIVGGQGEASAREFVVRTGTDHAAENDIEVFVPATDVESGNTAGLDSAGDSMLEERRARETFSFKVLQTPAVRFGSEYFLGDLVTAVNPYTGASLNQKIVGVTLNYSKDGAPDFTIETETP